MPLAPLRAALRPRVTLRALVAAVCVLAAVPGRPGEARAQQRPDALSGMAQPPSQHPRAAMRLDLERRPLHLAAGGPGWVYVVGGALVGGAVGFSIAAPDCLDGSRGCGSRPLLYAGVGAAVGAALGWAVGVRASGR